MSSLKIWQNVPTGSTLELSLAADTGAKFVGGARVLTGGGAETLWQHGDLVPGPATLRLDRGDRYAVRVRVGFVGTTTTTVTIRARIVRPDSVQFGSGYAFEVTGVSGDDPGRATIIIVAET